jgi:hypothetical protein
VIFIQQGGKNRHDHICESLELFARDVMPGFRENEDERWREKLERLAPAIERAMSRKRRMPQPADGEIPEIVALGRKIVEQLPKQEQERLSGAGAEGAIAVPLEDPARR